MLSISADKKPSCCAAFTNQFAGSGGGGGSFATGTSDAGSETRILPYEFSRGSADKRETTFEAAKRLADEVGFRFYSSAGALWYVSDQWLVNRPPVYRFGEYTAGVQQVR